MKSYFVFRFFKWVFFLAAIAIFSFALTGQRILGKTISEHFMSLLGKQPVRESIKDIRTLVGEAIKAVGSELSDEMTDDERKQLDDLVKKEMKQGTGPQSGNKQIPLPPEKRQ